MIRFYRFKIDKNQKVVIYFIHSQLIGLFFFISFSFFFFLSHEVSKILSTTHWELRARDDSTHRFCTIWCMPAQQNKGERGLPWDPSWHKGGAMDWASWTSTLGPCLITQQKVGSLFSERKWTFRYRTILFYIFFVWFSFSSI